VSTAALQALQASRARLRLALVQAADDTAAANRSGSRDGPDAAPGTGPPAWLLHLLAHWWHGHPWRGWSLLAADAADAVARPLAQRHPLALVAGAAGVGALLVWSRAWRGWSLAARWLVPLLRAGCRPPSGR
jgi:hypothetical protein